MAKLALIVALMALVIALLAYYEAGGNRALQEKLRALQGAVDVARQETADALARLERVLRPPEGSGSAPGKAPSTPKK